MQTARSLSARRPADRFRSHASAPPGWIFAALLFAALCTNSLAQLSASISTGGISGEATPWSNSVTPYQAGGNITVTNNSGSAKTVFVVNEFWIGNGAIVKVKTPVTVPANSSQTVGNNSTGNVAVGSSGTKSVQGQVSVTTDTNEPITGGSPILMIPREIDVLPRTIGADDQVET